MVKIQIWDTAGHESYRSIARSFYCRADGIVLAMMKQQDTHLRNVSTEWKKSGKNGNTEVIIYL